MPTLEWGFVLMLAAIAGGVELTLSTTHIVVRVLAGCMVLFAALAVFDTFYFMLEAVR